MDFLYDIKNHLFQRALSLKGETLDAMQFGDIAHRINKNANASMDLIYSDIFYGVSAVFDLIICLVLVSFINISMALVIFILATLTFIIGRYFGEQLKKIQKK